MPLSPWSSVVAFVGATFSTCGRPEHRIARGDHAVERRSAERLEQPAVLVLEPVNPVGALHDQLQRVDVDWFLIEIVGAEPDRFDRVALVAVPRDDHHFRVRSKAQDLAERGEALLDAAVVRRQPEVLEHDRRLVATQLADRRLAIVAAITS